MHISAGSLPIELLFGLFQPRHYIDFAFDFFLDFRHLIFVIELLFNILALSLEASQDSFGLLFLLDSLGLGPKSTRLEHVS